MLPVLPVFVGVRSAITGCRIISSTFNLNFSLQIPSESLPIFEKSGKKTEAA
jgi:hypothetical protein